MATTVTLANSTYSVDLASSPFGVQAGQTIGTPALKEVFSEQWGRGFHPLAGVSEGNREISLLIRVRGTSQDDVITNLRKLVHIVTNVRRYWASAGRDGLVATLSIHINGQTNTSVFDVLSGSLPDERIFQTQLRASSTPEITWIPLRLVCKPHARSSSLTTTTTAAITNGGGTAGTGGTYTLSAPAGDHETPMRFTFQPAAATDFERVLMSRRTRGTVANIVWPLQCEIAGGGGGAPATYTGYSITNIETSGNFSLANAAAAAASGGSVLRLTHTNVGVDTDANIIKVSLTTNVDDYRGRWRVFVRLHDVAGGVTVTDMSLCYGGSDGLLITVPTNSGSGAAAGAVLIDLGVMDIPAQAGPTGYGGTFNFVIRGSFPAVNGIVDLDCIYLMPDDTDSQFIDYYLSLTAGAAQDQLVLDGLLPVPQTYLLDSSNVLKWLAHTTYAEPLFPTVVPGVDNRWFVLMSDQPSSGAVITSHRLGDQFTLKFEYYPSYEVLF